MVRHNSTNGKFTETFIPAPHKSPAATGRVPGKSRLPQPPLETDRIQTGLPLPEQSVSPTSPHPPLVQLQSHHALLRTTGVLRRRRARFFDHLFHLRTLRLSESWGNHRFALRSGQQQHLRQLHGALRLPQVLPEFKLETGELHRQVRGIPRKQRPHHR